MANDSDEELICKVAEIPLPDPPEFNELQLTDVIKKADVANKGIFDILMDAAMERLHTEYAEGRITANHYSEAYIATINAVLSTSIQYANQVTSMKNSNIMMATQWTSEIQRLFVTKAQIQDTINGYCIRGMIGKQKEVHDAQIEGFKHKALQDAVSMMISTWTVRATTGTGYTAPSDQNQLCDANIGEAIKKLMSSNNVDITGSGTADKCKPPKS